jgi:hypothetical protein
MFDVQNVTYGSKDVNKLASAVSYLKVINSDGNSTSVLHRKLNGRLIEDGVIFSGLLQ